MKAFRHMLLAGLMGLLLLCSGAEPHLGGKEEPVAQRPGKTPFAWTLDEALDQLHLHPRDAYLQYVVMQLARREEKVDVLAQSVGLAIFGDGWSGGNGPSVDLFGLFSGALTLQQGLQLDTMSGAGPSTFRGQIALKVNGAAGVAANFVAGGAVMPAPLPGPAAVPLRPEQIGAIAIHFAAAPPKAGFPAALPLSGALLCANWDNLQAFLAQAIQEKQESDEKTQFEKRRKERIKLATLSGPEVASRPWQTLLAGRNPEVSRLSLCVPEDHYLAEFKSLSKMLDFLDTAGQWTAYLNLQAERDARTMPLGDRLRRQLALDGGDDKLRTLYDLVVEETAVTGSDLFFREGSDVTVLFRFKQPDLFRAQMDRSLADARKDRTGVTEKKGKLLDFDYVHLSTPDRALCVWSAYPEPGLHVRSNSEAALRRVLEAVHGKYPDGKRVPHLGASAELKYIRTLLPRAAMEEDGFVYLSEPFLRHMLSPRLKLTERRRRIVYNHLHMIGHAAQMYRTERGKAPRTLEDLAKANCCPGKFNKDELSCPFGGKYALSADGLSGICSHCGTATFLKPCCENSLDEINGLEAEEYNNFRDEFNRTWSIFFDPVAARVQVTPKRCRVETLLLPLPANEYYDFLAKAFNGRPEPLDALPVPKRNLFSVNMRYNKEDALKLLRDNMQEPFLTQQASQAAGIMDFFLVGPYALPPAGVPWRALAPLEEGAQAHLTQKVQKTVARVREPGVRDVLDCFLAPPGAIGPAAIPWLLLAPRQEIATVTEENSRLVKRTPLVEPAGPQRRLTREEALERDLLALAGDFERLLDKGIGNQAGLHVYDTAINFDFSLENVLSILMDLPHNAKAGNVQQRLGGEALMMALGVAPVVAPGYVSFPVRDAAIVDDFLAKVDKLLVSLARQRQGGGAFQIEQEYYKINGKGKELTRSYGVRVGPVRLRLFWARIGDGLYIANQAVVLNDIRTARTKAPAKAADDGPVGHAMIRLRPRNWDQALTGFRLAWAENNREACLHNLGPLSSGARAFCAGARVKGPNLSWDTRAEEAHAYAERLHGMGYSCPDGGRYALSKDGKAMTCSVHGSALDPRQPDAPAKDSPLDRLMRDFADLSATLTFAPEGLRAVVVIERR